MDAHRCFRPDGRHHPVFGSLFGNSVVAPAPASRRPLANRALRMVNGLTAQSPDRGAIGDAACYRQRPERPFNGKAVAEVIRRLEAG